MSAYVVTPIPQHYLPVVWGDLTRVLEPAVDTAKGKVGMDDLYLQLVDGTTVAWGVLKDDDLVAAFTTRVVEYPKCRGLVIDWVGGRQLFRWIDDAVRVMKEQARANDCQSIEGYGRVAWGRALKRHGFEPEFVAYRMELGDG
jgi:hypothetical protein